MSSQESANKPPVFKIGWWALMALSVLSFLNHLSLWFILPGEEVLFMGWAAFNLFTTAVIYIPYRRLEPWAWWLTWAMAVPYLVIFLYDPEIGPYYLVAGALMVVAQLMTRSAFTQ